MLERRIFIARHPSSQSIERFVTAHPIDWGDRVKAGLGGLADQCGYPPTYAMAEFASCYNERGRIPTQNDFIAHCFSQPAWAAWLSLKTPDHRDAYAHKLKRNFYCAAIDGMHVCALLYESGLYDSVTMSSEDDARLGVDVEVEYQERIVKLDLKWRSPYIEAYRKTSRPTHPGVGNVRADGHSVPRTAKEEFRRMARYAKAWDPWAPNNGAATRLAVLRLIDEHRAELGQRARHLDAGERQIDVPEDLEPISGEGWTIIPGDFRDVIPRLPPASVDLIVTDPPYSEDALELWSELGRLAGTLLVPQGILVALTGQIMLPAVLERLGAALHYGWVYAQSLPGAHSRILARHVTQAWKPWLAFSNGAWPSGRIEWHDDLLPSSGRRKRESAWQQQLIPARYLIEQLAPAHGLVCDPMLGTGTYGRAARLMHRRFLGIEADRDRLKTAVDSLESTDGPD